MDSLEKIYKENARIVYRYLLSLTHNSDLAEELTQETFYQAVKNVDRFDHSCRVSTWLCSIAKNQLRKHQRKESRHSLSVPESAENEAEDILSETAGKADSAENQVLSNWNRVEILQRIHLLPDPGREVLYLRIFGCLSFREIGEVMGKSENWARVTYYRGKLKLREVMNDEENRHSAL